MLERPMALSGAYLESERMEESLLYSPESVSSILEFSSFQSQNDYESDHTIFNDFGIGLDKECSDNLNLNSHNQEGFDAHNYNDDYDHGNRSNTNNNITDDFNLATIPAPSAAFIPKLVSLDNGNKCLYSLTGMNTGAKEADYSLGVEKTCPLKLNYMSQEEENRKRYPIGDSNSKNAIAARDNRLKKKKYVAELEETVRELRSDKANLSKEVIESRGRLSALEAEVQYLKSVIANQSTLSAILKSVSNTPGISLCTSFDDKKTNLLDKTNTRARVRSNYSSKPTCLSSSKLNKRKLRSWSNKNCNELNDKSVYNMTAKEIVQCCKNRKKKVDILTSDNSETDSEMEEIDVDGSIHEVKNSLQPQGDLGGVCLHVSGTKVSLEFCASCNMKANNDVSLDHSYSSCLNVSK